MSTAVTTTTGADMRAVEQVLVSGDLSALTPAQRVALYNRTCETLGLNPYTKPFDYIKLNGKLVLYPLKAASDQLRKLNGVSIVQIERETVDGLHMVTAHARTADGRQDADMGAVSIKGLQGEALANAYMKALTKAKRRVTLSICGLGWLDESEVDSVPSAQRVRVDAATGEILESPQPPKPAIAHSQQAQRAEPVTDELEAARAAMNAAFKASGWQFKALCAAVNNLYGLPVDQRGHVDLTRLALAQLREMTDVLNGHAEARQDADGVWHVEYSPEPPVEGQPEPVEAPA